MLQYLLFFCDNLSVICVVHYREAENEKKERPMQRKGKSLNIGRRNKPEIVGQGRKEGKASKSGMETHNIWLNFDLVNMALQRQKGET